MADLFNLLSAALGNLGGATFITINPYIKGIKYENRLVAFHDIISYDYVNKAWKKIILGQKDFQYEECKKEGVPLLTVTNNKDKKKFGQLMISGVGHLYR